MCGKKITCPSQLVPGKKYKLSGRRTTFTDAKSTYIEGSGETVFLSDVRPTGYDTSRNGDLIFYSRTSGPIGRFAADVMSGLLIIEEVPEVKIDYANVYKSCFGSGTYATAEAARAYRTPYGAHLGIAKRTMRDGMIVSLELIPNEE